MANQIQMLMYEGYLAEEPEMRYTPDGKAVTNFRIGSSRSYKTADGKAVKTTTRINVAAWGKLGEIVNKYCGKGSHVIVTGALRTNEFGAPTVYQNKNGEWRAKFEVNADEIRIIRGKDTETDVGESEDSTFDGELPY